MFRPDPNGPHSVEQVVAKLTEILKGLPSDSLRAEKVAELIRGLKKIENEYPGIQEAASGA